VCSAENVQVRCLHKSTCSSMVEQVSKINMRNGKYTLIKAPEDYPGYKYRGKYCYEHIFVWYQHTGEIISKDSGYIIHHRNGTHTDNRIENLVCLSEGEHLKIHGALLTKNSLVTSTCRNCLSEFTHLRSRNKTFCSRRCIGLYNFRGRYKVQS